MEAKQLKQEIMGIIKFEGVPMSSNEIWEVMTIDGHEGIERKLFNNSLTTLVTGEYLEKVPDEEKLNRYRYQVTDKGENWIVKQASAIAPERKVKQLETEQTQPPREAENKAPEMVGFDLSEYQDRFVIYFGSTGEIARVVDDIDEAKDIAESVANDLHETVGIHKIYSKPLLECVPVTIYEFREV
ncbi:hypothetical protein P8629_01550 [Hydrogenovibrio sp. 3SP14C1]|uniref:hypothetical protein n=1 Tax=Hydrogenovibrio sp. 3SP14C1 TaxID=3038774 RepID=UPI002415EF44|nr:hypothetical protein [Hydrogenovibrio sp. 3SP14C1]MDG4811681.1 hypothetical protein [Hydrogenovibrio sp. 3SP14C1]